MYGRRVPQFHSGERGVRSRNPPRPGDPRVRQRTAIAHAPDFVKGVINLRGTIVPIVDLRIKFALGSASYDEFTVVIILSVADRVIGVVVDGVSDVITLQPEAVQPPPQLGRVVDTEYILGMGSRDESMIILVDIERLLRSTDFGLLDAPAATAVH